MNKQIIKRSMHTKLIKLGSLKRDTFDAEFLCCSVFCGYEKLVS